MSATSPCDLRLARHELGQDPAEAQRLLAERGPHPVIARGGGVALVEHEVEHLQHRREPGGAFGLRRDLEGDLLPGERPLRADDPLRDGGLRYEERAGDLVGGQPAEEAQREGDPRFAWTRRGGRR